MVMNHYNHKGITPVTNTGLIKSKFPCLKIPAPSADRQSDLPMLSPISQFRKVLAPFSELSAIPFVQPCLYSVPVASRGWSFMRPCATRNAEGVSSHFHTSTRSHSHIIKKRELLALSERGGA